MMDANTLIERLDEVVRTFDITGFNSIENEYSLPKNKFLLAIDPGRTQSGYVVWDGEAVIGCGIEPNDGMLELIERVAEYYPITTCAIEMVAAMGMTVGKEVFETVRWIGRFQDRWETGWQGNRTELVVRSRVKMHLCGSMRAKDKNIRQALIDRFGKPGTKKAPGPLFGVSSHAWSALAVAVTVWDNGI